MQWHANSAQWALRVHDDVLLFIWPHDVQEKNTKILLIYDKYY